NLTGTWVTEEQAIDPVYWGAHLRHPVLFAQGAQELLQQPDVVLLEVGPGQTLASLARQQGPAAPARSVLASLRRPAGRQDDEAFGVGVWGGLWLEGGKAHWNGFYLHERRRRVALPSYPFERRRFWLEGTGLPLYKEGAEVDSESPYKKTDIADWFYEPTWK